MSDSEAKAIGTPKKLIAMWLLALGGGVTGVLLGRIFGAAIETTPAWLGPAILVGSLALILIAVLLSPAAIRQLRAQK